MPFGIKDRCDPTTLEVHAVRTLNRFQLVLLGPHLNLTMLLNFWKALQAQDYAVLPPLAASIDRTWGNHGAGSLEEFPGVG